MDEGHVRTRLAGRARCFFVFFCLLPAPSVLAEELLPVQELDLELPALASPPVDVVEEGQSTGGEDGQVQRRNTVIIGTGAALVAAYGWSSWWESGFAGGFKTTNEGWFGTDTQYGGVDKFGHAYSNYATLRLLTPLFETAGNSRGDAIRLAAWSTFGIYLGVEVLDGFSRSYEFSAQDATMNLLGAALGVTLETYPKLDGVLDFRLDYRPSPESDFDPFGDYAGQKYLLVAKADGFERLRDNRFLRYLEVAVGYGATGFDTGGEPERSAYLGLSLNLSRVLADSAYDGRLHTTTVQRSTERLFELVQFPTIGYQRWDLD